MVVVVMAVGLVMVMGLVNWEIDMGFERFLHMDSVRGGYPDFWFFSIILVFYWGFWEWDMAWLGLDFVWKKGGDVFFFSGYTIFVWRSVRGVVGR